MQIKVEVEIRTNVGRIDSTITLDNKIYIIEFKLGKSAKEALDQIKEKKYPKKYQNQGKEIILIGINFDMDERNISDWLVEQA